MLANESVFVFTKKGKTAKRRHKLDRNSIKFAKFCK